jgi:hypothetical protein
MHINPELSWVNAIIYVITIISKFAVFNVQHSTVQVPGMRCQSTPSPGRQILTETFLRYVKGEFTVPGLELKNLVVALVVACEGVCC